MKNLKIIFLLFAALGCSTTLPNKTETKRELASLNINYERSDKGLPITDEERKKATDDLIAILKEARYFDFVDTRAHGISENNSENKYWWGHWWTGVELKKQDGKVTYHHPPTGSDNTGIQTAPYLEGACYAFLITDDQKYARLARKMIRGMSSWILSSATKTNPNGAILSRAFYPTSSTLEEGGHKFDVDYDINRPGKYNNVAEYVHNPENPYFGDIYLKNNRSTDDIGHMVRAIANVQACRNQFDSETREDLVQMNTLYKAWAKSVDDNNFIIPTHNLKLETISHKSGIGDYNTYNLGIFDPACVQKLAVRLLHSENAGNMKCGKGISTLERIIGKKLNNDAIEILRSHHTAAVALAKLNNQPELAQQLMKGLNERLNRDFEVVKNNKISPRFDIQDIYSFFIQAHNTGVALTSEEMRTIYERLSMARESALNPANYNVLNVFNSNVPDGRYAYDPPHAGLYFYAIGTMIGSCTSMYKNPNARQLLDCDRLQEALR